MTAICLCTGLEFVNGWDIIHWKEDIFCRTLSLPEDEDKQRVVKNILLEYERQVGVEVTERNRTLVCITRRRWG